MAWRAVTALLLVPSAWATPAPAGTLCSNTDPGTCTLTFIGVHGLAEIYGHDYSWWNVAQLYDNKCRLIGTKERRTPTFEALSGIVPFSIDSTLPWTTDIKHLDAHGDYNSIEFRYAAYSYKGNFDCRLIPDYLNNNPKADNNACKHTFPCR